MPERDLLNAIMVAASRVGARLFRNTVGEAWLGKSVRITKPTTMTLMPGDVLVRRGIRVHFGLCVGSSDLVGWTPVKVTPDRFGETLAVWTAIEAKTGRVQLTDEQQQFLGIVEAQGGIAAEVRSVEDAVAAITKGPTLGIPFL